MDNPYNLDFMSTITNCNFGSGTWFGIAASSNLLATKCSFFLPAIDGGTPGWTLLDNAVAISGPSSKTVSNKDLSASIKSGAGKGFTGFSMGQVVPGSGGRPGFGRGAVVLQCAAPLNKPFMVQISMVFTTPEIDAGMILYLWKSAIKVGAQIKCDVSAPSGFGIDVPTPDATKND